MKMQVIDSTRVHSPFFGESVDAITDELGNFPLFTGLSPTELLVIAAQAQILDFQQA
jgi:hypothetical protein